MGRDRLERDSAGQARGRARGASAVLRRGAVVPLVLAVGAAAAWVVTRDRGQTADVAAPGPPAALEREARPSAALAPTIQGSEAGEPLDEVGAAAPAVTAESVVRMLDSGGAPLARAQWALFRGEEVLASGTTGADGKAHGSLAGEVELAVAHRARPPLRRALALIPGEETVVTLPAGEVIAGRVTVDGRPPVEPFELLLDARAPLFAEAGLPPAVWRALGREPGDVRALSCKLARDGAFRFEGLLPVRLLAERPGRSLRENWSWELRWEADWMLVDRQQETRHGYAAERSYSLALPAPDVELALESAARFRGRVIDPLTGAGCPRAWVSWNDGKRSDGQAADEAGAFVLLFPDELPARLDLTVTSRENTGKRALAFDLPAVAREYDAGDIALLLAREVAFTVRTAGGQPIAGAQGSAPPGGARADPRAVTDAQGRGSLIVSEDARVLRVVALGFDPAEVPLPPWGAAVEVRLRGATALEVRLVPPNPLLGIELRTAENAFERDGKPTLMAEAQTPGAKLVIRPRDDGSQITTMSGAVDGVHVFSGLRADLALELALVDPYGGALLRETVAPLLSGERRVVTLRVEAELGSVAGRVVAQSGEPVPDARVVLGLGVERELTGADGRFAFEAVAVEDVELVVSATGFAPWLGTVEVGPEPVELVLAAGRELSLSAVGPGGIPLPEGYVYGVVPGRWPSWSTGGQLAADGRLVLRDLPHEPLALVLKVGGRRFERAVAAEATQLELEVEAWQTCTVAVAGGAPLAPGERRSVTLSEVDRGPEGTRRATLTGTGDVELRFEPVFPGRYEASVLGYGSAGLAAGEQAVLAGPVLVEIDAHAPARVALRL